MDEDLLYREFGRRVAHRRGELTLSQLELADRIGLSRGSVANIERGKQRLSLHHIYRITSALELTSPAGLMPTASFAGTHEDEDEEQFQLTSFSDELNSSERAILNREYREAVVAPHGN